MRTIKKENLWLAGLDIDLDSLELKEASYTGEDLARAIANEDYRALENILGPTIAKFDKAAGLDFGDIYSDGYEFDAFITPEFGPGPSRMKGSWSYFPVVAYPGGRRELEPLPLDSYRKALLKELKSGIRGLDQWVKVRVLSPSISWKTDRTMGIKTASIKGPERFSVHFLLKKKPK